MEGSITTRGKAWHASAESKQRLAVNLYSSHTLLGRVLLIIVCVCTTAHSQEVARLLLETHKPNLARVKPSAIHQTSMLQIQFQLPKQSYCLPQESIFVHFSRGSTQISRQSETNQFTSYTQPCLLLVPTQHPTGDLCQRQTELLTKMLFPQLLTASTPAVPMSDAPLLSKTITGPASASATPARYKGCFAACQNLPAAAA